MGCPISPGRRVFIPASCTEGRAGGAWEKLPQREGSALSPAAVVRGLDNGPYLVTRCSNPRGGPGTSKYRGQVKGPSPVNLCLILSF